MAERLVTLDRRDDGVAVVRLDRPKMNALSRALLDELAEAAAQLVADPPGAVVVWGGERIFAAGADINDFDGPAAAREVAAAFATALDALASVPRVVIAAVTGYALGGGCELALACDFRVVADNAKLGQPEILLGIIPGGGGTQRLPRLVGVARAKELILSGRQVGADEALRIGLVDRVVPAGKAFGAAVAWASELAQGPVVAHGLAKQAIDAGLDLPLAAGVELERELFAQAFATEDATTGITSFLEHGPGRARFSGR
ncbi:MAG: enoyl-CoA hydratase/isomerase family protein [Actinobacteria bacterium]|nr:enoyl-CoA hydratase/isomerase family protein [Actinomycetota bacterium]